MFYFSNLLKVIFGVAFLIVKKVSLITLKTFLKT